MKLHWLWARYMNHAKDNLWNLRNENKLCSMNVNVCIDYVLALAAFSLPIKASHHTLCNYFHMEEARKKQVSSAALICHWKQDKWGSYSYACTFLHRLHKAHTLSQLGSLQRVELVSCSLRSDSPLWFFHV